MQITNCHYNDNKYVSNNVYEEDFLQDGNSVENLLDDWEKDISKISDEILEEDIQQMIKDDVYVGDTVTMLMNDIKNHPLLTEEREKEFTKMYATGNENEKKFAKDTLIVSNIRLVIYCANKFRGRNIPFEDLIQEGIIGLSEGIDKFDYKKGVKLSTYVIYWIRQAMIRYIDNNNRVIRIPVHVQEKIKKYKKIFKEFVDKNGYEADDEMMAKILNITTLDVAKMKSYMDDVLSIDKNMSDEENSSMSNFVADTENIRPEEYAEKSVIYEELHKIISTLKHREQEVIKLRFGLKDGVEYTLDVVGKKLNVTRERVRQIEEIALRKLKFRAEHLAVA